MKVLVFCKACTSLAYQLKYEIIEEIGDVEIFLVVPVIYDKLKLERSKSNVIKIIPEKVYFNRISQLNFYRRLNSLFEEINPDVCHIDEEHYKLVTFQCMTKAKKYKVGSFFFTWQNIYKSYPVPFSWMEKYNFNNSCMAVAGNEEAKSVLLKKGYKKEIDVIPQFGVDESIFCKQNIENLKKKLGLNYFTVGFIGRFVKEKGIYLLIDAVKNIHENLNLLFIGDGPEKNNLVNISKSDNKIKIINQVKSTEVPKYLNCMDLLVLPSITRPNWKEQFGRVLIEAMSSEVPVIGSNSGEIPNVIGDAGLVFEEKNVVELSEKIQEVMTNQDLRKELIVKGRKRVLDKFTQKIIAKKYYEVYKKIHNSD